MNNKVLMPKKLSDDQETLLLGILYYSEIVPNKLSLIDRDISISANSLLLALML